MNPEFKWFWKSELRKNSEGLNIMVDLSMLTSWLGSSWLASSLSDDDDDLDTFDSSSFMLPLIEGVFRGKFSVSFVMLA